MNKDIKEIAIQAMQQAQDEGLDDDDAKWMAIGAINREAREHGVVGDELPAEMNAASQAIVKQILK